MHDDRFTNNVTSKSCPIGMNTRLGVRPEGDTYCSLCHRNAIYCGYAGKRVFQEHNIDACALALLYL